MLTHAKTNAVHRRARSSSIPPSHSHTDQQVQIRHILNRQSVQEKLTIGAPNDKYEQEADRVADQVMRMPNGSGSVGAVDSPKDVTSRIQRRCEQCEEELQRKPNGSDLSGLAPSSKTASVINNLGGSGSPLTTSERAFFEPKFGQDFRDVRIHTDQQAAQSAHDLNAKAYTFGDSVAFARGEYQPNTTNGRRLLAHELTHVVQQAGSQQRVQREPNDKPAAAQCRSTSIRMGNDGPSAVICFATDSATLDDQDKEKLNTLISGLRSILNQQALTVTVYGTADTRGGDEHNQRLSDARALAVAQYIKDYTPMTAFPLNVQYLGTGEVGPEGQELKGEDLNDYRIVMVQTNDYSPESPEEAGCANLQRWLASGVFEAQWSGGQIEDGDALLCLLRIAVAPKRLVSSNEYGDYFPDDFYIDAQNMTNFGAEWNQETYAAEGGTMECSVLNYEEPVKDYVTRARKYIRENRTTHSRMRDVLCQKAAWWGRSDGMPDFEKAEKHLRYIIENEAVTRVRNEARMRAAAIDHPCELNDHQLIVNDIFAMLQEAPGSVYQCILDID